MVTGSKNAKGTEKMEVDIGYMDPGEMAVIMRQHLSKGSARIRMTNYPENDTDLRVYVKQEGCCPDDRLFSSAVQSTGDLPDFLRDVIDRATLTFPDPEGEAVVPENIELTTQWIWELITEVKKARRHEKDQAQHPRA